MEPIVQVDSYTKSRLPAAHPEQDPERPNHPTLGTTGAAMDHGTPRPADQETHPIVTSSIGLPSFFLVFFSLLAACGLLCAVVHGRKRDNTSVTQVTSLDDDKLQAPL